MTSLTDWKTHPLGLLHMYLHRSVTKSWNWHVKSYSLLLVGAFWRFLRYCVEVWHCYGKREWLEVVAKWWDWLEGIIGLKYIGGRVFGLPTTANSLSGGAIVVARICTVWPLAVLMVDDHCVLFVQWPTWMAKLCFRVSFPPPFLTEISNIVLCQHRVYCEILHAR